MGWGSKGIGEVFRKIYNQIPVTRESVNVLRMTIKALTQGDMKDRHSDE